MICGLGQFNFKMLPESKGRTFEGLECDGGISGIKKPIQGRTTGAHFQGHVGF